MVYGGAIASGAIAGTSVTLFGYTFEPGLPAYLAIAIAGTVGYLIGADDRLGDRPSRRPTVPRETRALAPPRPREARARRGVVPALGGLGRVPRAPHAGRAVVRLDPGRHLRGSAQALHGADADRLGDLVLRLRRDRLGCGRELGELPPARSGTRTSPWRSSSSAAPAGSAGATGGNGRLLGPSTRRERRPRRAVETAFSLHVRVMWRPQRGTLGRVMIPLVDVKAQYAPLIPELKERFAEVLESGRFIFGPRSRRSSASRPPTSTSPTRSASRTAPTRSSSRSRRWASAPATR